MVGQESLGRYVEFLRAYSLPNFMSRIWSEYRAAGVILLKAISTRVLYKIGLSRWHCSFRGYCCNNASLIIRPLASELCAGAIKITGCTY